MNRPTIHRPSRPRLAVADDGTTRRARRVAAIGVLLLGLAGCAPGPNTADPAEPSGPPASAPPTNAELTASSDPTPTGAVLAGEPVGRPCADGELTVTVAHVSAGATHRGLTLQFALGSDTDTPCVLTGYPGVDTGTGGTLLHARRTLRGYLGGLPPGSDGVPLALITPDRPATAVVEGSAVDASGNECPTYAALMVTPPDTTTPVSVPVSFDTCVLEVHPVVDGDAYRETTTADPTGGHRVGYRCAGTDIGQRAVDPDGRPIVCGSGYAWEPDVGQVPNDPWVTAQR